MAQTPEPLEKLVKVFDTDVESEAMVVRGLLESAGIEAVVSNREAPQDILPGVGGVVILVREEQAAEAEAVGGQFELAGPRRPVEGAEVVRALPVHGGGGTRQSGSCAVEVGH